MARTKLRIDLEADHNFTAEQIRKKLETAIAYSTAHEALETAMGGGFRSFSNFSVKVGSSDQLLSALRRAVYELEHCQPASDLLGQDQADIDGTLELCKQALEACGG